MSRLRSTWQISPFDDGARPSQAAAKHDHQNIIAVFDAAAAVRFIESDGHGRGGSVSIAVEVHVKFLERNVETIGNSFDDAQVRLMRYDTSDVVNRQARFFERFLSSAQHCDHRLLVNFFARHVNRRQVLTDIVPRDWATRSSTGHKKNVGELSIAADMRADHPMSAAAMLQNGRTRAVAKKHTGIAIGPIGD